MKKPNSLLNNLARIFVTTIYYLADSSHLLLNLFNRKYSIKIIYLRTITEKSHQLEKGFTKSQFRSCFGTHAIQVLIKALEKYHKMGFDVNDLRFKCGVDSLYMYKDKHVGVNCENCNKITRFFNKYPELTNHYSSGNFVVTNTELEKLNFDLFANFVYNRHSIRDFKKEKIEISEIYKVLELAQHTPSACNRQGWKIRIVDNEERIRRILKLHGGFAQNNEYVSQVLVITGLKNYYGYPTERNQLFVDSGLYSMNLMMSLSANNIGSCPLNTNFNLSKSKKIRKIINMKYDESFIMFIAIGKYNEKNTVAMSKRFFSKNTIEVL